MPAFQVALTTANTSYSLLTLVRAIDSAFADVGDMSVQVDDDGGAQIVLLGDAGIGSTRYGQQLRAGDFSAHFPTLAGLRAQSDTNATKLNITVAR